MNLPTELNEFILDYFPTMPEDLITAASISTCAGQLVSISLINKEFDRICSEKIAKLKKIYDFVNKYSSYNVCYQRVWNERNKHFKNGRSKGFDPKGNPQLLDALFTGCCLAPSSFPKYTPEITQDIKSIVKLTPQSLNCVLGTFEISLLGNRIKIDDITPLAAACINNVNIPLEIVEFLLQNGANPNAMLRWNRHKSVSILNALKNLGVDDIKLAVITETFRKYNSSRVTQEVRGDFRGHKPDPRVAPLFI